MQHGIKKEQKDLPKKASFTLGYKCASKEKKRKRKGRKSTIKDQRKAEKKKIINTDIFSLYQTMSEQYETLSIAKGREQVTITWLKPEGCMKQSPSQLPTKSLCLLLLRVEPKRKTKTKTKKAKAKTPKSKSSPKIQLPKSPIDP